MLGRSKTQFGLVDYNYFCSCQSVSSCSQPQEHVTVSTRNKTSGAPFKIHSSTKPFSVRNTTDLFLDISARGGRRKHGIKIIHFAFVSNCI